MDQNCVRLVEASPFRVGLDPGSWALLAEINGPQALVDGYGPDLEALLKEHGATTVKATSDNDERLKLWKARKVGGGLVGQVSPDVMIQDAVIPRHRLAEVLNDIYAESERANIPVINLFHAGDGNLHPNFMFDSRIPGEADKVKALGKALMQKVIAVGGTLSGEHGIGNDKMDYLTLLLSPAEMGVHEAVVQRLQSGQPAESRQGLPLRSYVGCCLPTPEGQHVACLNPSSTPPT